MTVNRMKETRILPGRVGEENEEGPVIEESKEIGCQRLVFAGRSNLRTCPMRTTAWTSSISNNFSLPLFQPSSLLATLPTSTTSSIDARFVSLSKYLYFQQRNISFSKAAFGASRGLCSTAGNDDNTFIISRTSSSPGIAHGNTEEGFNNFILYLHNWWLAQSSQNFRLHCIHSFFHYSFHEFTFLKF